MQLCMQSVEYRACYIQSFSEKPAKQRGHSLGSNSLDNYSNYLGNHFYLILKVDKIDKIKWYFNYNYVSLITINLITNKIITFHRQIIFYVKNPFPPYKFLEEKK